MMNLLGTVPLPLAISIVTSGGLIGVVILLWWVGMQRDNSRFDAQVKSEQEHRELVAGMQAQHKEDVAEILKQYKADVGRVTGYYERNVELVERYEKLSDDLSDIIHLNTQVMTRLVESINNNMFCPVVREAGPQRGADDDY